MAISKKEQKQIDEQLDEKDKKIEELQILLALRPTADVERDLLPPSPVLIGEPKLVKGYMFNQYSARVEKACSSSIYHAIGQWDKTTSQNPIKLFSTELKAYKALRHALEWEAAQKLRKVDLIIEKLEKE